jgi:hypothetical protein
MSRDRSSPARLRRGVEDERPPASEPERMGAGWGVRVRAQRRWVVGRGVRVRARRRQVTNRGTEEEEPIGEGAVLR